MEYNISTDEIMAIICDNDAQGFSEEELQQVEAKISAPLPKVYRNYLKEYGEEEINEYSDVIFSPDEVWTSYELIQYRLENYKLEGKSEKEIINRLASTDYYEFYKSPREKWNEITDEYVIVAMDELGETCYAYLLNDLKNNVPEPPIYVTDVGLQTDYTICYDRTEKFLTQVLCLALLSGYESDTYQEVEILEESRKIDAFIKEKNIDREKFIKRANEKETDMEVSIGNCIDRENRKLYFYFSAAVPYLIVLSY